MTAPFTYSDIEGGWSGDGNIGANPQFVDPDQGDVTLASGSPCIDAGDNDPVTEAMTEDLLGRPRRQNDCSRPDNGSGTAPIVDMGACEMPSQDIDESGAVDFGDILVILAAWGPCE